MNRNILISGYYGFDNFGDEAILSVLVNKFKNDNKITVFSSNPKKTSDNLGVNAVYSFDYKNLIKTIRANDVLISGGGSLLQDVTSVNSLIYYLGIIFLALFFKKTVIIFAQGIGPIHNSLLKRITILLLKFCDYVSVRDVKSHEFLVKNKVKSNLLCDPIFSVVIKNAEKENCVGIQLRNFPTLNDSFLTKLALEIKKHFEDKNIKIFSFQEKIDLKVCKKFQKILKDYGIKSELKYNLSIEETIQELEKLKYLIAMRFHALVVALKAGVKCLGINYDIKVEKLALEASIPFINMNSDFDNEFEKLLKSDGDNSWANEKIFDWSEIEKLVCPIDSDN